ncbi:CHY zinc finger protein [Alkalicoccus halolimnae]|uniref:CHY zinc finger protein n=1 Tax=Alkalicoccus halolimnae TaxID=1667239 RepID=A0A5C7FL54_9BACI|nr:CHY zinc finger protein [Alkalicoccus halolimnae]TXF86829.1 hypothetical protein FTX54_02580 [Alkalicoccus halolimnae]
MKYIHGIPVYGAADEETRCRHYHSETDRVALKCSCCEDYYPCYECHQEHTGRAFKPWAADRREVKAVLCGTCGTELEIREYLQAKDHCPSCSAKFNPNCALHYSYYFEPGKEDA